MQKESKRTAECSESRYFVYKMAGEVNKFTKIWFSLSFCVFMGYTKLGKILEISNRKSRDF